MKKQTMSFAAGVLTGAVLFGGSVAYAAGITAQYAPQTVDLDGKGVQMEAYNIEGSNYVKLRDIGQAVGFNVYWADNMVHIDSDAPYTGEAPTEPEPTPPASSPDYSTQATPAIFTGDLTREVYNAVRDTVIHRYEIVSGTYTPVTVNGSKDGYDLLGIVISGMGNYPAYSVTAPEVGKLAVTAKCTPYYDGAVAHTQPFIDSIASLSQREKVRSLVWYICDRMEYSSAITSPTEILASDAVTSGNCMSYAHSLLFLCDQAEIPCVLVHSETHQWNMVYVDGQWWDVDVGIADCAPPDRRESCQVLTQPSERFGSDRIDSEPDVTRFAQELLVPGSTK